MKTKKKRVSQAKPKEELKRAAKTAINYVSGDTIPDPDEIILCVPGGKCYTRAELEALETSAVSLFEMEGEDDDAES